VSRERFKYIGRRAKSEKKMFVCGPGKKGVVVVVVVESDRAGQEKRKRVEWSGRHVIVDKS
jgi:hypothetical protein